MTLPVVGVFLTNEHARMPVRSTTESACWDLHACITDTTRISVINLYNENHHRLCEKGQLTLYPGERALVPTGCIFDIPTGHSVRLHPRSGLAFKNGITLINSQGIVDSDYVQETFVALINHSGVPFVISHGDRIAQMEVCAVPSTTIALTHQAPQTKTNRVGGFGSTGIES
jgi:dUTP pyrophosphatase